MIALDEALTSDHHGRGPRPAGPPSRTHISTAANRPNRSSLDLKSAELATIAALTALRYPPQQLKVHIKGALTAGCSPEEIMEVILQTALYAGLPAAFDAMALAEEPFRAHAGGFGRGGQQDGAPSRAKEQPRLTVTHGSFPC